MALCLPELCLSCGWAVLLGALCLLSLFLWSFFLSLLRLAGVSLGLSFLSCSEALSFRVSGVTVLLCWLSGDLMCNNSDLIWRRTQSL